MLGSPGGYNTFLQPAQSSYLITLLNNISGRNKSCSKADRYPLLLCLKSLLDKKALLSYVLWEAELLENLKCLLFWCNN